MVPSQCRTSLQDHVAVSQTPNCGLGGERETERWIYKERQTERERHRETERNQEEK